MYFNSTAAAYWYVSKAPNGIIYQISLGHGYLPSSTGTYLAVVTNGCGSDSAFASVNSCPHIFIDSTVCNGANVFFNSQWLTQSGTYNDTIQNGSIDSIITLRLTVNFAPDTVLVFSSNPICNTSLDAYSGSLLDTAFSISQYTWKLNGNIVGSNSSYSPTTAGTYTVIATNGCGSDSTTYTVNTICTFSYRSDTICSGDSVLFNNQWLKQAGTYSDTIQNGTVDSIMTFELSVNYAPDTVLVFSSDPFCNTNLQAYSGSLLDSTFSISDFTWKLNGNIVGSYYELQPTTTGIYTVIATNGCGSDSTTYIVNSICAYKYLSDTICGSDSVLFNNQWLKQSGTYRDTIRSGSVDSIITLNLFVNAAPRLNIYSLVDTSCNTYLAAYDSATYTSSQINWTYNGAIIGYGFIVQVVSAGTYTAIEYTPCGNDTAYFVVVPCNIDSSDVWPGDANSDGIADNYDLLSIGIGYGISGTARISPSIVWQAQSCNNWGLVFLNGTNIKHADCDGNGFIDASDTTAVIQNFSLTHNKSDERSANRSGIPNLNIIFNKETYQSGDTLIASIQLGTDDESVDNLYGLAFTYNFDIALIDVSSAKFEYPNSWLVDDNNIISLIKDLSGVGQIKTAITRTDHTNRSGNGEIAKFRGVITGSNINTNTLTTHFISSVRAIDRDQNVIDFNEGIDSAIVLAPSGISTANAEILWSLYPNPAKSSISVNSFDDIEKISIYNVLGEKVYAESNIQNVTNASTLSTMTIDISALPNGIYIVQIQSVKGSGEKRFVVER
jgi:hypothetical protein